MSAASSPQIMLIALDAFDPGTAQRLASEGLLPTLSRLMRDWSGCPIRNPYGLFVGSLWTTFATARAANRTGYNCWDEIDIETYERRLTSAAGLRGRPFWETLSDAGRRVAVVDVPHSRASEGVNGLVVSEWGCHDRHFGLNVWPPEAASRITQSFGFHPVLGIDPYKEKDFAPDDYIYRRGPFRTPAEEAAMATGLISGVARKRDLLGHFLESDDWDLFLTVFGESHSIGHQSWHLHDRTHNRYDSFLAGSVGGDPVARVYAALDHALGDLLSFADENTLTLVMLSHGMGPHYDGTHLLDGVLRQIDLADRTGLQGSTALRLLKAGLSSLPGNTRRRIASAGLPIIQWRKRAMDLLPEPEFATPDQRATQRFFLWPNNYVYGGVRLNIEGRESRGIVDPSQVADVISSLEEDLLALINVETGRPVINSIERSDRHYEREERDYIPDLFLDWERSAPVEVVWSPKTGFVHAPYTNWRTGDHRPAGLMLASGPGIDPAQSLPMTDAVDIGPSLASRLGVELVDVDGRPVRWLSGSGERAKLSV